jgi:DNA processing protein
MEERRAYIVLNMMEGVGPVKVRSLVATLGSASAVLEASMADLCRADGVGRETASRIVDQLKTLDPAAECGRASELGIRIVTCVDPEYPRMLAGIHDPPLALYVQGSLPSGHERWIAVVGTRHATHYGREFAGRLSFDLAQAGCVVVSGLARGIDTAAHSGALKARGRTVAVLGGGLDRVYPAENKPLAGTICGTGAVISEFVLGRQPDKTTFPIRNRIISGLVSGVVVVEAALRSGAIITAEQALSQGRTVFAVPGRADSPLSRGTHRLIRDGACLIESAEDVLREFDMLFPASGRIGLQSQRFTLPALTPDEQKVVVLLQDGSCDVDGLIRQSGLDAAAVGVVLLGLEMKKVVQMLPGRVVELTAGAQDRLLCTERVG